MKPVPPPGMVRYEFDIRPRDGSRHVHLSCDIDELVTPRVGDSIGLDGDYGVTTEVMCVSYYPTCDPMVYVRGRGVTVETAKDAEEIAKAAVDYGWRVS